MATVKCLLTAHTLETAPIRKSAGGLLARKTNYDINSEAAINVSSVQHQLVYLGHR